MLIMAGCALYMVSGGIRSNFGIIVQALADRTGVSYADVSFAVAVGQARCCAASFASVWRSRMCSGRSMASAL